MEPKLNKNRENICLIGFQCSGKTTVGPLLAKLQNKVFIDTDQIIEKKHPPLTCREIHIQLGEKKFRDIETEVLYAILPNYQDTVIAVGGGTLLSDINGRLIQNNCRIIYLKTDPEILKKRIFGKEQLPSYLDVSNLDRSFDLIYKRRCEDYDKWAEIIIDMSEEIEENLERINEYLRVKSG